MDIRKVELMKSLQREYYGELRFKKKKDSSLELFVYRLVIVLLVGILVGSLLH